MPAPLAACLSPLAWNGLWTSRHAICSELSERGWNVVFVDPPSNMARRRPGRGSFSSFSPSCGIQVVQSPSYFPYGVLGVVPRLASWVIDQNARRYAESVACAVGRLHPDKPVDLLINSFMPVVGKLVQHRLRPRVSLYHRSDELSDFPSWRPLYSRIEVGVARESDVVVCVSDRVKQGIDSVRPDAVILPNGVDLRPYVDAVALDERVLALPRPISVMVGVFDRRVDRLLLDAAAAVSSLVMVGRLEGVDVPAGATWLGHVDHNRIPGILAAADVGVVCYRPGWSGDLLKIYEYLAAGLPVVSSHTPALPDVRAAVSIAATPREFSQAVREAASRRSDEGDASRRSVAQTNSWHRRVDELLLLAGCSERRTAC